jgi:hypothetical protein
MLNITQIPADRVAFIDEKTGRISREWYRFLLNLFELTGGGSNPVSITDSMVGPTFTTAESQIAELQKAIQGLALTPLAPSISDTLTVVLKRLQDLEVGPSLSGLVSDIANLQQQIQNASVAPNDSALMSDIANLQQQTQNASVAPNDSALVSEVANLKTAIQALEQAQPVIPTILPTNLGTVTSVDVSGGSTGLTFSGGPITTAGTITMAGTLGTANGGTGSTSSTFVNLASNVTGTLPVANGGTGSTSTTFVNLASNVTGTLPVANGGTGASSLTGAGIVTITDTQTITGVKALSNANNTFYGLTYATSDGGTGSNAYFGENAAYAVVGGVNGVVLASGTTFPGTGRFVADPNTFRPFADDVYALGTASFRYTVVYATTGTINTSDATQKQQVRELNEAERRVAKTIKGLIRAFKWNEAVESKGDGARIHIGVMAQEVAAAFAAEGLDATKYGLFCQDTWTTLDGSQTRFGVRYEELLAFVIAAL